MFNNGSSADNIFELLQEHVGSTVTIFTTSGGQSGFGFTGVLLLVNPCFIRLVTNIGPAPGCALGNACNRNVLGGTGGGIGGSNNSGVVSTVGSVVDIPIDRIASFVHNAV